MGKGLAVKAILWAATAFLAGGAFLLMDYLVSQPGESLTERAMAAPLALNLDDVGWASGPQALRAARPGTQFRCYEVRDVSLGNEVCWAAISRLNRIEARVVAVFFRDGRMSGLRVTHPARHYAALVDEISYRYGRGDPVTLVDRGDTAAATIWLAGAGSVLLTDPSQRTGEVVFLWSSQRLEANPAGRSPLAP